MDVLVVLQLGERLGRRLQPCYEILLLLESCSAAPTTTTTLAFPFTFLFEIHALGMSCGGGYAKPAVRGFMPSVEGKGAFRVKDWPLTVPNYPFKRKPRESQGP